MFFRDLRYSRHSGREAVHSIAISILEVLEASGVTRSVIFAKVYVAALRFFPIFLIIFVFT